MEGSSSRGGWPGGRRRAPSSAPSPPTGSGTWKGKVTSTLSTHQAGALWVGMGVAGLKEGSSEGEGAHLCLQDAVVAPVCFVQHAHLLCSIVRLVLRLSPLLPRPFSGLACGSRSLAVPSPLWVCVGGSPGRVGNCFVSD